MNTVYREAYEMPITKKPRKPINWLDVTFIGFLTCAGIALLLLPVFSFYEASHKPRFPATVQSNDCQCTCWVPR